jgi:hypothetical protein
MNDRLRVLLTLFEAPADANFVSAPPVLIASTHTVDYCCGKCETVLLHAEKNQVHSLLIHCTNCGAYNATDS